LVREMGYEISPAEIAQHVFGIILRLQIPFFPFAMFQAELAHTIISRGISQNPE
jgi:hypothetical protein